MEGYAQLCISACTGNALFSADEHAKTRGPNIDQRPMTQVNRTNELMTVSRSGAGCLPSAWRALMVGGMLPWPLGTLLSSVIMHRWFPAVVTGSPISVSKIAI